MERNGRDESAGPLTGHGRQHGRGLGHVHPSSAREPLDIVFSDGPTFSTAEEHEKIVNLIRSVLTQIVTGLGQSGSRTVILETLRGGRSGSYVFKVTCSDTAGHRSAVAPVVVKISSLEDGTCEKVNYDRFVRAMLPAALRSDLLGFATTYGRSALCYSFVGDGETSGTLTDCLAAGDLSALDFVLSTLFGQLRQSWYSPRLNVAETDLARYYLGRYFDNLQAATETEERLFGCTALYFDARRHGRGYRIADTHFPPVCETLFSRQDTRAYKSCVLHGDLNTDNIIVDRNRPCARLIDFQRTGRGHVFQDLVSLEACVRINYPPNAAPSDILETERLIALGEPQIPGDAYAMAMGRIREVSRRIFGKDEEFANYHFAVATVGLRLMQATDLEDAALARISASTLWAAKTLSEN